TPKREDLGRKPGRSRFNLLRLFAGAKGDSLRLKMKTAPVILIVDDDEGHALLVRNNLEESGLSNQIEHFRDGQSVLDFLFRRGSGPGREEGQTYLVLLDIRMPKVDGIE